MNINDRPYVHFRFYLEGIAVNCGSSFTVMGNSNYGLDANGNPTIIASRDLTRGFRCLGHNSFYYSTYEHTVGNSPFLGTGSACRQQFTDSFPSVGDSLDPGEFIVFYITVNTILPIV
jgi:hypothetical protein